jgi:hypothetical protein
MVMGFQHAQTVILAKAGIPLLTSLRAKEGSGIPAFAGMTGKGVNL